MRRLLAVGITLGLLALSIPFAGSASAAISRVVEGNCNIGMNNRTFTIPSGDSLTIEFTTCSRWQISSSSPGAFASNYAQGGNLFNYTTRYFNATGPMGRALPDGTYVVFFADVASGYSGTADGSFTISVGGGGGGGDSSSTTESAPALETLTLQVSTGNTTCTGGSPTGYNGSWLQLPAADACSQSGPTANPNAKLLGWATDPIFPVSVAQQIVDLKYGPIDDYFYGMRMIFIPAGGWTFVSGSNNLYPIWSE